MKKKELTIKHRNRLFAKEYIVDFNGGRAYSVIYKNGKIDNSCYVLANKLLRKVKVQKLVKTEAQKQLDKADLKPEEVINRLANIMRGNLGNYVVWDNNKVVVENSDKLTEEQKYLIQEISETKDGIKIKLMHKLKAMEMLGKYLKLWVENQVNIQINYTEWAKQQNESKP